MNNKLESTEIYGEISIDVYDKNLEYQANKLINLLGNTMVLNTQRNSVIFYYATPKITTPNVDEVSDILCEKLEPFADKFANFYAQNKDKCYMHIYFVTSDLGEEGIAIIINQRLLNLAVKLGVEIQFDGL